MNKVALVGRMTKDPELMFGKGSGTAVCKFTIAVNRRFKKEGQPDADFLPVTVFGKQAESTANWMRKGSQIAISGNIQTSNYMKDAARVYKTEIIADEVHFLDSKKDGDSNNSNSNSSNYNQGGNSNNSNNGSNDFGSASDITPIDDGDIPF